MPADPPKISDRPVSLHVGRRADLGQAGAQRLEGAAAVRVVVPARRAVVDWRFAERGRGSFRRVVFANVRRHGLDRDAQSLRVGRAASADRESRRRASPGRPTRWWRGCRTICKSDCCSKPNATVGRATSCAPKLAKRSKHPIRREIGRRAKPRLVGRSLALSLRGGAGPAAASSCWDARPAVEPPGSCGLASRAALAARQRGAAGPGP